MKIRTSLLVLIVVNVAIIGVISMGGTNFVKDSVSEIVNRENPKIQAAMEMEINMNEMSQSLLEILEQKDQQKDYADDANDFKEFSEQYRTLIRTDEELQKINELDVLFNEYETIGLELIQTHTSQIQKVQERRDILNESIENVLDEELQSPKLFEGVPVNKKLQALNEMEINIHELISASRGYLLKNDAFLKDRVADSIEDFRTFEKQYEQQDLTPMEREYFETLRVNFNDAEKLTFEILELEDLKAEETERLDQLSMEMDELLDDHIQKIAEEKITEDEEQATVIIDILLIVLPITFTAIIVGAYLFSNKFTNITAELVRVAKEFEKGNLDARIKVSRNDEIGELGNAMNVMAERLQDASKEQGEFAAMITHELKTPLVPIKGYAEMLANPSFGELNSDQKEAVDEIEKNSDQLHNLIQNVLNAQKLEVGGMKYNITEIDVDQYATDTVKTLTPYMEDKKIEFTNEIESGLKMKGDTMKLTEIFTNIVQNAVDFVPEEGGKITIIGKSTDTHVEFCIQDNGIGMSKEAQKNLFHKFYQVDTSHTRKHGGSGLGLSICQGYIEDMEGKIWCESEKGKGSKFFFTLPKVK